MYLFPTIGLYGFNITCNNLSWHCVLHEKFITIMKFRMFKKHQKSADKKKDQVLQIGRKQFEKLAKKGIMIQLVQV